MDGVTDVMPRPILKLSSLTMVRDAVHTGVGAALLPLSMVTKDIVRGTLARWGDVEAGEVSSGRSTSPNGC